MFVKIKHSESSRVASPSYSCHVRRNSNTQRASDVTTKRIVYAVKILFFMCIICINKYQMLFVGYSHHLRTAGPIWFFFNVRNSPNKVFRKRKNWESCLEKWKIREWLSAFSMGFLYELKIISHDSTDRYALFFFVLFLLSFGKVAWKIVKFGKNQVIIG